MKRCLCRTVFFESPQDETEDKLASVLDSLESKFGETAVMSGALWQRFHGDNGTRRKRSELKAAVDARSEQETVSLNKSDVESAQDDEDNIKANMSNTKVGD